MSQTEVRKSQFRLILLACIMVFLLFLGYTILWEVDYFSKYGNFKRVKCTVIDHYEENDKVYDVFVFETDKHEFVEKITPFESKYEIDESFHVYYDTETEVEVIYNRDIRVVMLPIITAVFGCVCGGITVIYIITYKKNKVSKS